MMTVTQTSSVLKDAGKRLALVVVTTLVAILVFAPGVNAIESEGFGAIPANPDPDRPRTSSIFVYDSATGKTISDAIKIVNNTDKTKTISLYPVDSQLSSDGAFACAQAVDERNDVGSWIKMSKSEITLKSLETKIVNFKVSIPKNAEAGEHNGCIVIQDAAAQNSQEIKGVVLSFRSAIRVAITIPGDIKANLTLNSVIHTFKDKVIVVTPSYTNDGNVSLDADVQVRLTNIIGQEVASAGGKFPVLASTEAKFNFEFDRPYWGGFYKRSVDTGYSRLSDQESIKNPSNLDKSSTILFVMPQPTALVIEALLLAIAVTFVKRYLNIKKKIKRVHKGATKHTVKKGDDIQSVAKEYGISWKLLTKINKLKAPYTLKAGQILKVPGKSSNTKKG